MRIRLTLCICLALSAHATATELGNGTLNDPFNSQTDFTTADTPICSAAQNALFDRVFFHQQSIFVKDPDGHLIGFNHWKGWIWNSHDHMAPVDGAKHTVCGTNHHYSFESGWTYGDEADANLNIIPALFFG